MTYTDLIYDFDGTIADSYPIFAEAFLGLLNEVGITADYDRVMSLLKVSVKTAMDAFDLGEDEKVIRGKFRDVRNALMAEKGEPMEGAEELLKFVKDNGGRNYIYTHSPSYIWDLLEKWGLKQYFEGGVTSDDDFPIKPAPDALNFISAKYGLDKSRCLMVGDRDIDVEAGKNACMKGVLLDPDGFYTAYNPDFRVTALSEIKAILQ